jgi:predicted site-specific integrase-resolvase
VKENLSLSPQQRGALKLKDAADYLSISPVSMRRLIKRGLIKPIRSIRHLLISVSELNRFLELK